MGEILKIHSVETSRTLDGLGIRYVLFFHDCPFRCKFCSKPDIFAPNSFTEKTVDEVLLDVLKYEAFLKFSNGGFTASGGEPTLQMTGLLELFKRLKENGIHTALETCGYVNLTLTAKEVLDFTDMVVLGIKHLDPQKHLALTGKDNEKVFEFLKYLNLIKKRTWLRVVLLEGVSLGTGYAEALADFASQFDCIEKIELVPYSDVVPSKFTTSKKNYPIKDMKLPSRASIKKFREVFERKGFEVVCKD